jgi:hypothetical protein
MYAYTLLAHVVIMDTIRSQEINSVLEKRFAIIHATIQIERYRSEPGFKS